MITLLDVLGIHEGDIERASDNLQDALEEVGLLDEYDDIVAAVSEAVANVPVSEIQDFLIESLYAKAKAVVEEKLPDSLVHYYVNGYDSHFYINRDEGDMGWHGY